MSAEQAADVDINGYGRDEWPNAAWTTPAGQDLWVRLIAVLDDACELGLAERRVETNERTMWEPSAHSIEEFQDLRARLVTLATTKGRADVSC